MILKYSSQPTMSSLEIARLTEKNHSDVMRDIRNVLEQAEIGASRFAFTYLDPQNKERPCFRLPKRECDLVISGYSVKYRLAIIDRWQELESKNQPTAPQLPQNYLEALEQLVEKEKLLIAQAPKVAFVDNLVTRHNLLNATQVGQPHKLSAVKLNKILDEIGGIYNKSVKRGRAFCQSWVDKGYGEMKITESGHNQCLFTILGEQKINEILISEGVL